jgi:hypothetical protein
VEEFVAGSAEWTLHERRRNNNGLTVLKRVGRQGSKGGVKAAPAASKSKGSATCDAQAVATVTSKYHTVHTTPGDIDEHMPVIYEYVKEAEHATEIGVRNVVSSWAFAKAGMERVAEGKPFTYVASDITKTAAVSELDRLVLACPQIQYRFEEGDDLLIEPWETDVLMIDTWHTYRQLAAELQRWAPYAKQYILLHDTELFGAKDEGVEGHGGKPVDESLFKQAAKVGLWPAVEEFVAGSAEWTLHERRRNNNGLTVLKRVGRQGSKGGVKTAPAASKSKGSATSSNSR